MDAAAPERGFSTEFIDSLSNEEEEKHEQREQHNCTTPLCNEEEESADVWSDIAGALNQWTQKILDAETSLGTTVSIREKIEASLHRQQLDGFLNNKDIAELRYIADLWTRLLHSTSSYKIVTILLELYKLRHITDCLFIEECSKL